MILLGMCVCVCVYYYTYIYMRKIKLTYTAKMKGFMRFVHTLHKYKKNEHFVHNTIYKQSGINILSRKLTLN